MARFSALLRTSRQGETVQRTVNLRGLGRGAGEKTERWCREESAGAHVVALLFEVVPTATYVSVTFPPNCRIVPKPFTLEIGYLTHFRHLTISAWAAKSCVPRTPESHASDLFFFLFREFDHTAE